MLIVSILAILTLAAGTTSWHYYNKGRNGLGNFFTAIAAVFLGSLLKSLESLNISNFSTGLMSSITFISGMIGLVVGIILYMSQRKSRNSFNELGIEMVWPNRGDDFEERTGEDYLSYTRQLLRKTKPGKIVRLLSTAGDGVAIVTGGYGPAFKVPLKNGCRFRIILMNPCSERVTQKQESEDKSGRYGETRPRGFISQKIVAKMRYLNEWREEAERELDISKDAIVARCIDDVPIVNLVDNGDVALVALQVINRKGSESPVFLVNKGTVIYDYLQDHFDFLFEHFSISSEEALKIFDEVVAPELEKISETEFRHER